MKRIVYFTAAVLLAFLPGGCFDDKGNYDYTPVNKVTVEAASAIYEYSAKLGDHLGIPMTVTSDEVPESAMRFTWEFKNSSVFRDLADQTGKDFDRKLGPDGFFNGYATFYMRLKVEWEERGSTFTAYSPMFKIALSGAPGLLVMHGNDAGVDLGLICDKMFLVSASATTAEKISYDNYSSINGAKIPGKGIFSLQHDHNTISNALIYTLTDQGMVCCSPISFEKLGTYDDLFYSTAQYKFYQGKPEALFCYGGTRLMIDGGDIFESSPPTRFTARTEFKTTMPAYEMSKHSMFHFGKNILTYVGFEKKRRGVVKFLLGGLPSVKFYNSTKGPFNVDDMKADPLHFSLGGLVNSAENFIGVFKDDDNELFIGEIKLDAPDETGNTWARYKYSVATLPEFASAKFYGFGISNAMCYYATGSAVYQFVVAGAGGVNTGRKLSLGLDGQTQFPFSGEITMMKVLRPSLYNTTASSHYQLYGEVMLVATYENGVGTLYAIKLDQGTGNALSYKSFTGFDRIYDANLKTR